MRRASRQAEPHGEQIARIYDLIVYGRDDVEAEGLEWQFLLRALSHTCPRPVRDVLDVGCGTGRHVLPLAREGFAVTGLDNSRPMLETCRRRLRRHDLEADLLCADMEQFERPEAYDAALLMDSVVCCLHEPARIVGLLRRLWRALRPGGLLMLDNHNFLGRWEQFDQDCSSTCESQELRVEYHQRCWYDDFPSLFHLEIVAQVEQDGSRHEVRNEDVLKAMTADETVGYLERAGFEQIAVRPDYGPAGTPPDCSERLIFLAIRPDSGG